MMTICIACDRSKPAADFAGEYTIDGKPLCDECFEFDNDYVDVCAKCGAVALAEDETITPVSIVDHVEACRDETGSYACEVDVESDTKYCDDCYADAKAYAEDHGIAALDARS